MLQYKLFHNWEISFPDDWSAKYDTENGQYIFYPADSDLTFRLTPFHARKEDQPAPIDIMENAYTNSIPISAKLRDPDSLALEGLHVKAYENKQIQNGKSVYSIHVGYYTVGNLLSINIFGTYKPECEQALCHLKTIKFSS